MSFRSLVQTVFILFFLLWLLACTQATPPDQTGNNTTTVATSIPATTRVLDSETLAALVAIQNQQSLLVFSRQTAQLATIKVDDVLVIAPITLAPDGLLRKVESISQNNGQIEISTRQAYLTEAIENGEINFDAQLSLSDIEKEENLHQGIAAIGKGSRQQTQAAKHRQQAQADTRLSFSFADTLLSGVELQGDLDLQLRAVFNAKIRWFKIQKLETFAQASEAASLRLVASKSLSLEREKRIKKLYFRPFTVWLASLPVYIRPVMEIYIGAKATTSAQSTTEVSQQLDYKAGLLYQNSNWQVLNNLNKSFNREGPSLDANVQAKAYIKTRLLFFIYGVSAPYIMPEGYLQLEADINKNPWCTLYAGVSGDAGIAGKILSYNLGRLEKSLFDVKQKLYECKKPSMMVKGAQDLRFAIVQGSASGQGSYQILAKDNSLDWQVSNSDNWLSLSQTGGTIDPNNPASLTVSLNSAASNLAEGTYIAPLAFSNLNNGQGDTKRRVIVDVRKPSMSVEPSPDTYLLDTQEEGGNFTAKSQNFTLAADIGSIDFQVSSTADWLNITPSSGTVVSGSPQTIQISLDPLKAQQLTATTHRAQVEFINLSNGAGNTSRSLFVQPTMRVSAGDATLNMAEGDADGQSAQWQIEAINGDIAWQVSSSTPWLILPVKQGTVSKGGSQAVQVQLDAAKVKDMVPGSYSARILFSNTQSGALIDRSVRQLVLNIKKVIEASPQQMGFSMSPGGTASPASASLSVSSQAGTTLTLQSDVNWLTLDTNTLDIPAGQSQTVTVTVNSNAQSLPEGVYSGKIVLNAQRSGRSIQQTVTVQLSVSPACNTGPTNFPVPDTWVDFIFDTNSGQCSISQNLVGVIQFSLHEDSRGNPSVYIIDAISQGMYFESVVPSTDYRSPYFGDRSLAYIPVNTDVTVNMVRKDANGNLIARYSGIVHVATAPYRLTVSNFRRVQ